jgi:hypothetical protein
MTQSTISNLKESLDNMTFKDLALDYQTLNSYMNLWTTFYNDDTIDTYIFSLNSKGEVVRVGLSSLLNSTSTTSHFNKEDIQEVRDLLSNKFPNVKDFIDTYTSMIAKGQ